jgi:phage tail sheath protein FI
MTTSSLAKDRKTPGVYVTEFPSFPANIVGVPTALPVFIGYTKTARDPSSKKPVYLQPIRIASMADYYSYFEDGYDAQGVVSPAVGTTFDFQANVLTVADGGKLQPPSTGQYSIATADGDARQFNMYAALQLFFANGGGDCFVISVKNYWGNTTLTEGGTATEILYKDLSAGLAVAGTTKGPTITVIPDACQLKARDGSGKYTEYATLTKEMMKQASDLQDRVALLDLPGALDPSYWSAPGAMKAEVDAFYLSIAESAEFSSYGAAYGPTLQSSLLTVNDVDYTNLSGTEDSATLMNCLLTSRAWALYQNTAGDQPLTPKFIDVAARIGAAFPIPDGASAAFGTPAGSLASITKGTFVTDLVSLVNPDKYTPPTLAADKLSLDQYLSNAVPLLSRVEQILADQLNITPPCGAVAGIWAFNDATKGVWNAPANVTLSQVSAPKVDVTDKEQGEYNAPLNGYAIDILRAFPGRGTVVWGARTLDANSLDYRYVQVRRTLIYIEQSIKNALQQYVFAPNNGGTWATVTASISNFLTQFWQAGGLMGDKASDAFTVSCGVPTTMSGLDVLNGYMVVNVTVQLIHPAEFIELTFRQTMQGV